jgi:hypothetical protein
MKKVIVVFLVCQSLVYSCLSQHIVKNNIVLKGLYLEIIDASLNCDRCHATKCITTDSSANYEYDFRTWIILTNKKTLIQLASFFYQNDNGKIDLEKNATINAYEINIKEDNKIILHYVFSYSSESRDFFSKTIEYMKKNKLDENIVGILESSFKGINW